MAADLQPTLARLQADLGISQAGLAHMLGVRRQTMARWLAGGRAVWVDPWPAIRNLQALVRHATGDPSVNEEAELAEVRERWPLRGKWARAGTPSPGGK